MVGAMFAYDHRAEIIRSGPAGGEHIEMVKGRFARCSRWRGRAIEALRRCALSDWHAPSNGTKVSSRQIWIGPALDDATGKWKDNSRVRRAGFKTSGAGTPLAQAEKAIVDFYRKSAARKKKRKASRARGLFERERRAHHGDETTETYHRKQREADDRFATTTWRLQACRTRLPRSGQNRRNPVTSCLGARIFEDGGG